MNKETKYPDDYVDKIICGDCLEVIKGIPDRAVDLVLTDPPYGVYVDYGMGIEDNQDNLIILVNKIMPEILRVSKRALITTGVLNAYHYPTPDWVLAWTNMAGANSSRWGFSCWQPILAYGKDPYLQFGKGRTHDVIPHNETAGRVNHPCPKPDKFWEKLLLRGSVHEGDIILDPFLGSGTTAEACKLTHRHFIGIEINPDYCKIAEDRLRQGVLT